MIIGLFRTILVLIIFYFLVKFLGRLLFPPSSNKSTNNIPKGKEGDITIHFDNRKDKKLFDKDSGEYVDYEDVDEDEGAKERRGEGAKERKNERTKR